MDAPRRMGDHTLDALKGWRINDSVCLDHRAKMDATWPTTIEALQGMVVRQTSTGTILPGCNTTNSMPMFLMSNWFDKDVGNYGGDPATDFEAWVAAGPTGVMNMLVATGGYELMSTEIDHTAEGGYTIGAFLTSPITGDNRGKLIVGTLGTDVICGRVSRVIGRNPQNKQDATTFFTLYLPVYP